MDSAKAGVAAITMVTGADPFLPRWLAHYQGALPENQIYVLNLGADAGVAQMVAKAGAAINLVRLPLAPDQPDAMATSWKIMSQFASGLTQFYNWVIVGATDELIAPDPERGADLVTCLMARLGGETRPPAVLVPLPIEILHLPEAEPLALGPGMPVLGARMHYRLNAELARPAIVGQPLEYSPDGRASKHTDVALDRQIYAFHLRLADTPADGRDAGAPVIDCDWPHLEFRRNLLERAHRLGRFLRLGGGTGTEIHRLPARFAGIL